MDKTNARADDKFAPHELNESFRDAKEKDVFRDTPVRYLGYANEVGEAFRALVHVNWVRLSYAVASSYVCADAHHKGKQAAKIQWPQENVKRTKVIHAVVDTVIWQGLASVAIPGFTINRICYASGIILKRAVPKLPTITRGWIVTGLGLGSIPFIIKPIDAGVDWLMENTFRKWCGMEEPEEELVHHKR